MPQSARKDVKELNQGQVSCYLTTMVVGNFALEVLRDSVSIFCVLLNFYLFCNIKIMNILKACSGSQCQLVSER